MPKSRPDLPIIGLIGPTNLRRIAAASGIAEALYREAATRAGTLIARRPAILAMVPDRGIALAGLEAYAAAAGPWSIGLVPEGGPSDAVATANCRDNAGTCDEVIGAFTWHHQHAALCELSDLLVCVGLSCGTIAEIAWTKWVRKPRVLALRETFTALPPEILAETDVVLIERLADLGPALARHLPEAAARPDHA